MNKVAFVLNRLYLSLLICWCAMFLVSFTQKTYEADYFSKRWMDFSKFYAAAQILASEERSRLYDPYLQREKLTRLIYPTVPPPVQLMDGKPVWGALAEQTPFFLAMYVPFTYLPKSTALLIMTFAFWLAAIPALAYLCKAARTLNMHQVLPLFIGATASGASCWNFVLAQPTWLLVALYCVCIAAWLKKQDWQAGLLLALCAIKPQYPPFFALAAIFAGRWKLALAALLGAVILGAVSYALIGSAIFSYVPMLSLIENHAAFGLQNDSMPTVRGLLTLILGNSSGIFCSTIISMAAACALAYLWWYTRHHKQDERWALALTFIAAMLFNPHSFRYDALLLVIPAALTLKSLNVFEREVGLQQRLWTIMLVVYPVVTLVLHLSALSNAAKTVLTVAIHVVLLVLAVSLWKRSSPNQN